MKKKITVIKKSNFIFPEAELESFDTEQKRLEAEQNMKSLTYPISVMISEATGEMPYVRKCRKNVCWTVFDELCERVTEMRINLNEEMGLCLEAVYLGQERSGNNQGFYLNVFGNLIMDEDNDIWNSYLEEGYLFEDPEFVVEYLLNCIRNVIINYSWLYEEEKYEEMKGVEVLKERCGYSECKKLFNYYDTIEHNDKKAFHWAKKLARFGDIQACKNLSYFYRTGRGVDMDGAMARKLMGKVRRRRR